MYIMINTNTEEIVTKKKKVYKHSEKDFSVRSTLVWLSSDFASGRLLAKNFTSYERFRNRRVSIALLESNLRRRDRSLGTRL